MSSPDELFNFPRRGTKVPQLGGYSPRAFPLAPPLVKK